MKTNAFCVIKWLTFCKISHTPQAVPSASTTNPLKAGASRLGLSTQGHPPPPEKHDPGQGAREEGAKEGAHSPALLWPCNTPGVGGFLGCLSTCTSP